MRSGARHERGAALLAVLAMVVLLAGLATLGLERLRAAGTQVDEADARAEAQLLASAGTAAALSVVQQLKARAQTQPAILNTPLKLELPEGEVRARFGDGGNCFNLNSLSRPPATSSTGEVAAAASPRDFSRLLTAAGIPILEANAIAAATAARLGQTGQLWADATEWIQVPGVGARHWALAGRLLCALPSREVSAININSLGAADAPLLAALGLGADQARRAVAGRPSGGWASSADFLGQSQADPSDSTGLADQLGTTSRWMVLDISAATPRTQVRRRLLIDTIRQPAQVVSSRWLLVEETS